MRCYGKSGIKVTVKTKMGDLFQAALRNAES
jgi:hypothetical protein